MSEILVPRTIFIRFAGSMEARLRANDSKGKQGWLNVSGEFLREKLKEECEELLDKLENDCDVSYLIMEAADVANVAAMLQDRRRTGHRD